MSVLQKRLRSESGFESPNFYVDSLGNIDTKAALTFNGTSIFTSTSLGPTIVTSSLTSVGTLTGLDITGNLGVSGGSTINLLSTAINISASTGALTLISGATGSIAIGSTTSGNTSITAGAGKKVTITSGATGNIDNMNIGATTAADARVNNLTILGTFSLETQTFLTSNPATVGTIDNYNIGATTSGTGKFTTLTATTGNITTVNADNLNATVSTTIAPTTTGSIDNVTIGSTTPAAGKFTNVTITTLPTLASHATTKQYVDKQIPALAIALGA